MFSPGPLRARLLFTLGSLVVFRIGSHTPLAGVDASSVVEFISKGFGQSLFGLFDTFSGGSLSRMSVMVLGLMPNITAGIVVQLLTVMHPKFEALKKEGESGRRVLNTYTRYGTVALASFQSLAVVKWLETVDGAVLEPGFLFLLTTVTSIVGATLFLMWLGEQITARGLGQGSSAIIYAGIVASLPHTLGSLFELGRTGAMGLGSLTALVGTVVGLLALVVCFEMAFRKIIVLYPRGKTATSLADSAYLPMKLNVSGVMAPIFTQSLLGTSMALINIVSSKVNNATVTNTLMHFAPGKPLFFLCFGFLIIFFSFFYSSIVFNTEETSENLRKNGSVVMGCRPGKQTALYFEYLLNRLTVMGSTYMAFVCLVPQIVFSNIGFSFGGTSLLIVVGVTIEMVSQIQSYLVGQKYKNIFQKNRPKGRVQ